MDVSEDGVGCDGDVGYKDDFVNGKTEILCEGGAGLVKEGWVLVADEDVGAGDTLTLHFFEITLDIFGVGAEGAMVEIQVGRVEEEVLLSHGSPKRNGFKEIFSFGGQGLFV